MKNTKNSRFDSKGCYTCRCCGKLTRETGGEESSRRICGLCDDKGALEIRIMDNIKNDHPMKTQLLAACETSATREELGALQTQVEEIIESCWSRPRAHTFECVALFERIECRNELKA